MCIIFRRTVFKLLFYAEKLCFINSVYIYQFFFFSFCIQWSIAEYYTKCSVIPTAVLHKITNFNSSCKIVAVAIAECPAAGAKRDRNSGMIGMRRK